MDAREVKVIDTSGRNGHPGQDNWIKKPAEGKCPSITYFIIPDPSPKLRMDSLVKVASLRLLLPLANRPQISAFD